MKKTILVLAMFGGLSGDAFANGSSAKLYGIIDEGVTHFTGVAPDGGAAGQTASSTALSGSVQSGSRIGLEGTEDLGNGLSVIYDAETGFCATGLNQDGNAGSSTPKSLAGGFCTGGGFMQRQAWVGMKGQFGELQMGRMYSLGFMNEAIFDPFGWGLTGNIGNLSLYGMQGKDALARTNQTIQYTAPKMSGLTIAGSYSFAPLSGGTVPTASGIGLNVTRDWSLNGQYDAGPASVGLNYTRVTNEPFGLSPAGINDGKMNLWQIYGSWNFGVAKLVGVYEKASGDYASGTTLGAPAGDNRFWMLGLTVPVGAGVVMASFSEAKVDGNSVFDAAAINGTAKQYALGYSYPLSTRTNLYASYGNVSNDTGTAFASGAADDAFGGVAGQASSGAAVGVRHMF